MILDEIAQYAKKRVAEAKAHKSLDTIRDEALRYAQNSNMYTSLAEHSFLVALQQPGLSFICEIKRASPSKGLIAQNFPYVEIAKEYERSGADCISCLTEPKWFLGSDEIFSEVRAAQKLPMLVKDFIVDAYQIYKAKLLGAQAVLLIAGLLDTKTISAYLSLCDELRIDALVEAHTEAEISSALTAGARIIGVNNRNLADFSVDFSNAERLRSCIPEEVIYVAESGVKSIDDVSRVVAIGSDAVLIGEVLMRAQDKAEVLQRFRSAADR